MICCTQCPSELLTTNFISFQAEQRQVLGLVMWSLWANGGYRALRSSDIVVLAHSFRRLRQH